MESSKAIFLWFLLTASLGAFAQVSPKSWSNTAQADSSQGAWEILERTMANHRNIPCKALILRRALMDDDKFMEMWSEQSEEGKLKLTVLSPLSEQGVVSVDDGQQWITYRPDDNSLLVEQSPRREAASKTKKRINLAKKNYQLVVEEKDPIVAGRNTYSFIAYARHPEMPARRYCIDRRKDFLLRIEILGRVEHKTVLDTKAVEFPINVPSEDFTLLPHEAPHVVTYQAPMTVNLDKHTESLLGFDPCIPKNLPFGFVIEQPQLVEGRSGRFMAVRITDGLVNATVYEWNGKSQDSGPEGSQRDDRFAKGVRLRLVGDVPPVVEEGLMGSFTQSTVKPFERSLLRSDGLETQKRFKAFNISEVANREERQKSWNP